jgi:hypothetical protein
MCKRRADLARSLYRKRPGGGVDDIPGSKIEGVVDFFEQVGTYLAKELIDEDLAWDIFFDAATLYWMTCGRQYSIEVRSDEDKTMYNKFESMVKRMDEMYYRKTSARRGEDIYTNEEIDDFLLDEQRREPRVD